MAKTRRNLPIVAVIAACLAGGFAAWMRAGLAPTESGPKRFIRFEHATPLRVALRDPQLSGVIRNPSAVQIYAWILRRPQIVTQGTYAVAPGMTARELLAELTNKIRQRLRLPETNWSQRTANLLEEHDVAKSKDYMDLVRTPQSFASEVSFPITGQTLEGYLYPDTYDLPPLLGARSVIDRQLKTFQKRVWEPLHPRDLYRTLIVASLVQMETGRASDAPIIAGVIENRLKKKMPLQIDAGINYALQKMRRLHFRDYREVNSPYNTYLHTGLPPGPICSPTVSSIQAALNPAHHDYLYYVALPDGSSVFSKTYDEHLHRIALRKHELALIAKRPSAGSFTNKAQASPSGQAHPSSGSKVSR